VITRILPGRSVIKILPSAAKTISHGTCKPVANSCICKLGEPTTAADVGPGKVLDGDTGGDTVSVGESEFVGETVLALQEINAKNIIRVTKTIRILVNIPSLPVTSYTHTFYIKVTDN
jgi:hypothetical protein